MIDLKNYKRKPSVAEMERTFGFKKRLWTKVGRQALQNRFKFEHAKI